MVSAKCDVVSGAGTTTRAGSRAERDRMSTVAGVVGAVVTNWRILPFSSRLVLLFSRFSSSVHTTGYWFLLVRVFQLPFQRLLIAFYANRKKRVDEFLLLLLFCLTCFLFSLINNIWIWFLYSQISLIGYFTCFLLRRPTKLAMFWLFRRALCLQFFLERF